MHIRPLSRMAEEGMTAAMSAGQLAVERALKLRLKLGGQCAPEGQAGHVVLQRKRHQLVNGLLAWRLMHHRCNAAGGLHQPALFRGKVQRLVMMDLRTTAF
ncbi:MAG: hypothetical protein VX891_02590, partial [Candidatus Thermoplasmatota archaeon]|nr:hypothetical protein [Candidatus Thermoplasmatota archaeon]